MTNRTITAADRDTMSAAKRVLIQIANDSDGDTPEYKAANAAAEAIHSLEQLDGDKAHPSGMCENCGGSQFRAAGERVYDANRNCFGEWTLSHSNESDDGVKFICLECNAPASGDFRISPKDLAADPERIFLAD